MKCAAGEEPVLGACWLDAKLDPGSPAACHDLFDAFPPPLPQLEVKPLPPFPAYTGHLSINGISGHHFHAISQRLPEENNNYPTQSGYGLEQDIVTSTCSDPPDLDDVKPFPLDETDTKPFADLAGAADSCTVPCSPPTKLFEDNPKQEMYDIKSFEDIAALIGASIVDTTSQPEDPENSCDSWLDLDKLINGHYNQHGEKIVPADLDIGLASSPTSMPSSNHQSGLEFYCKPSQEFTKNQELDDNLGQAGSTLHRLLTQGYMPILQTYKDRLQVKQETPSSTSYGMDVITNSSPPCNVVSTTNGVGSLLHGRYAGNYGLGLKQDGLCSPDRLLGYPHAHTTTGSNSSKSRSKGRAKPKHNNGANLHAASLAFSSATAAELSSLLGKEGKDKPMHRCGICNRGFLNKSNIKVHLRTHTGEKPFRCDVCAKAFRQKAHLIKHQQIHKRIGRD